MLKKVCFLSKSKTPFLHVRCFFPGTRGSRKITRRLHPKLNIDSRRKLSISTPCFASQIVFLFLTLQNCENLKATLFLLSKQNTNKVLNCVKNWRWVLPDNLISYYFLYITQNMSTLIGSPLSSTWLEARLGSPRYGLIRGWARLGTALFGAPLEALFWARFGSARLWLGVWLGRGQGVDITIPVTCSVFEVDPMTSQCTRGVPRLKFRHKIHERWVIFSFVAIASQ